MATISWSAVPSASILAPIAFLAIAASSPARALAVPPSPPGPPGRPPSASLSLEASSAEGLEGSSLIKAGGAELRLRARWPFELAAGGFEPEEPFFGVAASFPYLRYGAVSPAGLAAFVLRPASAAPALLDGGRAPLALAWPEETGYRGASLGEAFGVFVVAPTIGAGFPDASRASLGAWLSSPGGSLASLSMVGSEPPVAGGPGWYDVPSPPSHRAFAAASARAAGSGWAVGAAGAASLGFPGEDAAAARAEARAAFGPLRADATASVASASWLSPDGKGAPFLRVAARLRFARRGYAASVGYRLVRDEAPGRAEPLPDGAGDGSAETETERTSLSGTAEAVGRLGAARVAASLEPRAGERAPVLELDARVRPGFAPWLTLASSWRAADGASERFDVFSQAAFGRRARVALDAGLRFAPEGALYRYALSVSTSSPSLGLRAAVRTPGWIGPEAAWYETLEYSAAANVPLRR